MTWEATGAPTWSWVQTLCLIWFSTRPAAWLESSLFDKGTNKNTRKYFYMFKHFMPVFCMFIIFVSSAVLGEPSAQPSKSCGSSCLRTGLTSSVPSKSSTATTQVCVAWVSHSVLRGSGVMWIHYRPHMHFPFSHVVQRKASAWGESWAHVFVLCEEPRNPHSGKNKTTCGQGRAFDSFMVTSAETVVVLLL